MSYSFVKWTVGTKEVEDWLAKELMGLRSGRATPAVLDAVFVDAYGVQTLLKYTATIALEGPRTLRIIPFDKELLKEIEKVISLANLGLSVSADDAGIRAHFPELTGERRTALIKTAKEKLEAARIHLRRIRDEAVKDIEAKEKEGGMGEDEKFRLKKELDKFSEGEAKKLHEQFERKEKEILS